MTFDFTECNFVFFFPSGHISLFDTKFFDSQNIDTRGLITFHVQYVRYSFPVSYHFLCYQLEAWEQQWFTRRESQNLVTEK